MGTVRAVFEDGVFRPREHVSLPEGTEVEFVPQVIQAHESTESGLDAIYEVLLQRHDAGDPELATRHNEHRA